MTLESAEIIEKTINIHFLISFDYKNINKVMRVIKEKSAEIVSQKMEMSCEIEIVTRKKNAEMIFDIFNSMFEVAIKQL
jgi:putative IMPACT (imprinted ancient) family translation regulator